MSLSKNNSALQLSYEEFCPQVAPVIFLHGTLSCKETWKKCVTHVANKTGSRVYYYDARSHGCSPLNEDMSSDAMTEDLSSFMNTKNVEKAVIVGHSMGGRIGLKFALKYPEKVHCLILEDISLQTNAEAKMQVIQIMQFMKEAIHEISSSFDLSEAKRYVGSYLNEKIEQLDKGAKSRVVWVEEGFPLEKCEDGRFQWKKNFDIIEHHYLRTGKGAQDISEGSYKGPVLTIYGTDSPFKVLQDKEKLLKLFPNAVYIPIEGGTHQLHLEFADIFNKIVCDFIIKNR